MEMQIRRGCGLDVHQATVVACLLIVRPPYPGVDRPQIVAAAERQPERAHCFFNFSISRSAYSFRGVPWLSSEALVKAARASFFLPSLAYTSPSR